MSTFPCRHPTFSYPLLLITKIPVHPAELRSSLVTAGGSGALPSTRKRKRRNSELSRAGSGGDLPISSSSSQQRGIS